MINNNIIYFNQEITNNGNYESISLITINKKNKLYLYDCVNDNIKITINKIINPNSKKGQNILFYLGFLNKDFKIIIKCNYSHKSKYCYNYKSYFLFIITSNLENSPKTLYKYRIYKNNYIYNNTLIQTINE
jgi:hypothetical protein